MDGNQMIYFRLCQSYSICQCIKRSNRCCGVTTMHITVCNIFANADTFGLIVSGVDEVNYIARCTDLHYFCW